MWSQWYRFIPSAVARAPSTRRGVYQVALAGSRFPYPDGWSSIIYIGAVFGDTRSLQVRLLDHLSGRGNPVIAELVGLRRRLKVRWRKQGVRSDPLVVEGRLLANFEHRYGELPAGNSRRGLIV